MDPTRRLPEELTAHVQAFLDSGADPAPAKDASTVVLLRGGDAQPGGLEVYLLRRVDQMAFAGGFCVFPGGGVDPRDFDQEIAWAGPDAEDWAGLLETSTSHARALVCAAVRETFEESGVLLAGPTADTVVADTTGEDWEAERRVLQLLIASEPSVRRSEFGLLALEIAWLRAAELPKVAKIQQLLSGGVDGGGGSQPGSGGRSDQRSTPAASGMTNAPAATASAANSPVAVAAATAAVSTAVSDGVSGTEPLSAEPTDERPEPDASLLPDLLELIGSRRQSLAAHLAQAHLQLAGRSLSIEPPAGDTLLTQALGRRSNVAVLTKALESIWGPGITWSLRAPARDQRTAHSTTAQKTMVRPSGVARDPYAESAGPSRLATAVPAALTPDTRAEPSHSGPPHSGPPRSGPARSGPPSEPPPWIDANPRDWNDPSAHQPGHSPRRARHGGRSRGRDDDRYAAARQLPVVRAILESFGGHIQSVDTSSFPAEPPDTTPRETPTEIILSQETTP